MRFSQIRPIDNLPDVACVMPVDRWKQAFRPDERHSSCASLRLNRSPMNALGTHPQQELESPHTISGVVGRLRHALMLTSSPARYLALLHWHYGPRRLHSRLRAASAFRLYAPVFARQGCQGQPLLFRAALSQRATACHPGEGQHPLRSSLGSASFRTPADLSGIQLPKRLRTQNGRQQGTELPAKEPIQECN